MGQASIKFKAFPRPVLDAPREIAAKKQILKRYTKTKKLWTTSKRCCSFTVIAPDAVPFFSCIRGYCTFTGPVSLYRMVFCKQAALF